MVEELDEVSVGEGEGEVGRGPGRKKGKKERWYVVCTIVVFASIILCVWTVFIFLRSAMPLNTTNHWNMKHIKEKNSDLRPSSSGDLN